MRTRAAAAVHAPGRLRATAVPVLGVVAPV